MGSPPPPPPIQEYMIIFRMLFFVIVCIAADCALLRPPRIEAHQLPTLIQGTAGHC